MKRNSLNHMRMMAQKNVRARFNRRSSQIPRGGQRFVLVLDAAVIGGKDSKWGERVVAIVVADPATQAPSAEEIVAWCRERLAHFKCPRDVHFVAELPRNATGKLLKTELRGQFTGIEGGVVLR